MLIGIQTRAADPPPPLTPDCRYLFIVDTSISMARLQAQSAGALQRMVSTGLDGQMAPGEVFTIWTFNDEVQQREYPLNSWTPELNQSMGNRVLQFMQVQRYRRTANMRALINAVYQAKRSCPRLAVFLISNGQEVLVGTPFDRNINVGYGRRFEELRAAKVPFLTTLLCQNGDFVAWSVGAANEPVRLPRGVNGEVVVGRNASPDRAGSIPVVSSSSTAVPAMKAAPTAVAPLVPKQATPVAAVRTNRAGLPRSMRPPIITIQGGPEPERKIIDVSSASNRPAKPLVVKPTEIAPKAKIKIEKTVFRKTNEVAKPVVIEGPKAVVTTPEIGMAKPTPPATNRVAVAKPPVKPIPATATPAPEPTKPVVVAPETVPAVKPAVVKTKPPVVVPPEPKVVIQVVTQVVMVPVPSIPSATVKPAPAVVVAERTVPTPEPEKVEPPRPSPVPAVSPTPEPVAAVVPAVTNTAAVAETPPTGPPPPPASGLGFGVAQNMMAWVYLGLGIVVLLIAIGCIRKLANRPIEASMISQSMERRDNR